jgi:hypothetical protein
MSKEIKMNIEQFSIQKGNDFIDVEMHHTEGWMDLKIDTSDFYEMIMVNEILWNVEDSIRNKERNKEFDQDFIEMARSVYITNDRRAEIKKEINKKYNSDFVEEKSYEKY